MAFFRTLDENHDGIIDGLEVQDYEQKVAPEILPHIDDLRAGEGMDASLAFDPERDRENREDRKSNGLGDSRPLAPRTVGRCQAKMSRASFSALAPHIAGSKRCIPRQDKRRSVDRASLLSSMPLKIA